MPTRIDALAEISVARGCGFAALAIFTFMVGLSWDMVLACKVGGLLVLFVCVVLTVKAQRALRRSVRKTELWMMLDRRHRPCAAIAQRVMGETLRACYLRFALLTAGLSAALLAASLMMALFRGETADLLALLRTSH
jgi:hypothetical protein